VDGARRAAPELEVEIREEIPAAGRELFVDGTMLQQALLNLIVNAIQATPNGSAVTVRADVASGAAGRQPLLRGRRTRAAASTRRRASACSSPSSRTKATGHRARLALSSAGWRTLSAEPCRR